MINEKKYQQASYSLPSISPNIQNNISQSIDGQSLGYGSYSPNRYKSSTNAAVSYRLNTIASSIAPSSINESQQPHQNIIPPNLIY